MFLGSQNFWVGLLFSEFSVDLKNKIKDHLAKSLYLSPSFLSVSKKKSHPLETAARERGVWVGTLEGRNFCLGGAAPFCSPVVAALLIRLCPEHDNTSGRNRISTVLQCLTILLSHAKWFLSILLQSVVLNLLYSGIGLASELNLSNQLE